jgi:phosphatidylglycerol:prolipoprotein diacylglycerol transferase
VGVLAAIPYTTFPELPLGLRTFGLMVALGVLIGARLGSSYSERFGVHRDDTYRTGTLMVLAGIVGSRLTWVLTHTDQVDNPIDVIAIWEGGIQFSGGFIAALIVGFPMFRRWTVVQRWHVLNGYAWGLTLGVAIGRIGCYAVGEHFGRTTDFFLGTRYEGGDVREPFLGDVRLTEGTVFHNTALYELLWLVALFLVITVWIFLTRRKGREVLPATFVALFMVWYGVARFLTDILRVNDERTLSMTGAQWMSLVMVPYGLWVWFRTRPKVAKLVGPDGRPIEAAAGLLDATDEDEAKAVPDELAPPDDESSEDAVAGSGATGTGTGTPTDDSEESAEPEGAEGTERSAGSAGTGAAEPDQGADDTSTRKARRKAGKARRADKADKAEKAEKADETVAADATD